MSLEWQQVSRYQCPFCYAHSPTIRSEETRAKAQFWYDQHQLDCPDFRDLILRREGPR